MLRKSSHNGSSVLPSHGCLQALRSLARGGATTTTTGGNGYCTTTTTRTAAAAGFHASVRVPARKTVADSSSKRKLHKRPFPRSSTAYAHASRDTATSTTARRLVSTVRAIQEEEEENDDNESWHIPHGKEENKTTREILGNLQDLLDQGKPIHAAQMYLEYAQPPASSISIEKRDLACKIFFANIKADNVLVAKDVFDRLAEVPGQITRLMWASLIVAMAQSGYLESVATTYLRFSEEFYMPTDLLDIVLRSLIQSRRLLAAERFLYKNLQRDRHCGLVGAYLRGTWKRTRSLELLDRQTRGLLRRIEQLGRTPTEKFFNPVILAYIETGRFVEVEALVQDMQTQYGIAISCRTRGLLLFQKAVCCEWDAVLRGLEDMHAARLTRQRRTFAVVFDRVFREYYLSHSASEIHDLVVRAVEEYGLVPDDVLYMVILEAYIAKGERGLVDEFIQMGRDRSWNMECTQEQLLHMMQSQRRRLERAPTGAWANLRAARSKFRQASSSAQLLGYERDSSALGHDVNRMPDTGELMASYRRKIQDPLPSRSVDEYQMLELPMEHFMHVGQLKEALRHFNSARNAGFMLRKLHVEMATVATLLLRGLDDARAVARENWRRITSGVHHYLPIFFRQVMEVEKIDEWELIKMAIFHFYNLCENKPQLQVKHHIVTIMSRELISMNQPERAQDLLVSVYKSRFGRMDSFSGSCMGMFVRAFAAQGNLDGVRWCLVSSLVRTSALTREMVVETYRVMAQLTSKFRGNDDDDDDINRKLAFLEYVATLMMKKSMGELAIPFQVHQGVKQENRNSTDRWHIDPALAFDADRIGEMAEIWDEPYELAIVLGEKNTEWDKGEIVARWKEAKVLEDQWAESSSHVVSNVPAQGKSTGRRNHSLGKAIRSIA